jgi:hypothetical protein
MLPMDSFHSIPPSPPVVRRMRRIPVWALAGRTAALPPGDIIVFRLESFQKTTMSPLPPLIFH